MAVAAARRNGAPALRDLRRVGQGPEAILPERAFPPWRDDCPRLQPGVFFHFGYSDFHVEIPCLSQYYKSDFDVETPYHGGPQYAEGHFFRESYR